MRRNIDPDFLHDSDRKRMNVTRRLGSSTGDAEMISRYGPEYPFRQMAPARVTGAKDENKRCFHVSLVAASGSCSASGVVGETQFFGQAVSMLFSEVKG